MRKKYVHAPRKCVVCESIYTPKGATQKYCSVCKPIMYRKKWMEFKRNNRMSPHPEAQFTTNDIVENTDFMDNVRERIRKQRGDLITVKKVVRHVLINMDMKSTSGHARKICYAAVEKIIVDEFQGEIFGASYYGGTTFKLPKERKT